MCTSAHVEQLRALFGLAADATEDDIVKAIVVQAEEHKTMYDLLALIAAELKPHRNRFAPSLVNDDVWLIHNLVADGGAIDKYPQPTKYTDHPLK